MFAIFGCFPGCIWNGGTLLAGGTVPYEIIQETIEYYNYRLNLPLTFTFTNPMINSEDQLHDIYSNLIAKLGHNGKNYINVSSPVLEKYLKENYPNYHYCRSIVTSQKIPYDLNGYEISVLQRAKNNDWNYLNTIPEQDRGRIELLLNDVCPDNCPKLYSHYEALGKAQIIGAYKQTTVKNIECISNLSFGRARMMLENKTYISNEQLIKEYLPAGFRHFKFSGRTNFIRCVLGALNYMILPMYHEDLMMFLFKDYNPGFVDINDCHLIR